MTGASWPSPCHTSSRTCPCPSSRSYHICCCTCSSSGSCPSCFHIHISQVCCMYNHCVSCHIGSHDDAHHLVELVKLVRLHLASKGEHDID